MTSKVWDKQHGGSHYQNFKIQPSKFVVENELLFPEGMRYKIHLPSQAERKKGRYIEGYTLFRNDT